MENTEYRSMVEKVLEGIKLNLSDEKVNFIVNRLSVVNKMTILANNGNENYHLRSTQVICKIIDDCLTQMNVSHFI